MNNQMRTAKRRPAFKIRMALVERGREADSTSHSRLAK